MPLPPPPTTLLLEPLLLGLLSLAANGPIVYFKEQFLDREGWTSRWVKSKHKSDFGKFVLNAGKFYGGLEKGKGLQRSQDARFCALSARFEPLSNKDQTLVVQFTVKCEQNVKCGDGYVKLFPKGLDQMDMRGDSEYIIFGPDICGPGTKRVHVIFNYKGKNVLINKDDEFTHLYTLIVQPDNTYEVKIDNSQVVGSLEDVWAFLPPRKVKDSDGSKLGGWGEQAKMDYPTDSKPQDWGKPEHISDPDAKKTEGWDEEMDKEWEPPVIRNPGYKGEWNPRQMDNLDYKGTWIHPEIDSPKYSPDTNSYACENFAVLGPDIWQVKCGTIFDNFLINDTAYAEQFGNETWGVTKAAEKQMKEKQDGVQRLKEEDKEKKHKEEKEADKDDDEEDKDEDEEEEDDEEEEEEDAAAGQAKDEL
ncbi:LOW QUALITY PROTEIN: calreticulin-like [Glossophaga mutica]